MQDRVRHLFAFMNPGLFQERPRITLYIATSNPMVVSVIVAQNIASVIVSSLVVSLCGGDAILGNIFIQSFFVNVK
jgi:hypothetical protein